jgi:transcriptional regulator with XRE-family HTH domain
MIKGSKKAHRNPVAVQVGERIRDLRLARGMKQATLAQALGYASRSAIAQFENGFAVPSLDKALEMARFFGVPVGALLGDPPPAEVEVPTREAERVAVWAETRCHELASTLRAFAHELETVGNDPMAKVRG